MGFKNIEEVELLKIYARLMWVKGEKGNCKVEWPDLRRSGN